MADSNSGWQRVPLACSLGRSDEPRDPAYRGSDSCWPDPETGIIASDHRTPEAVAKANTVYFHPAYRASWLERAGDCRIRLGFSFNPARTDEENVTVSAETWDAAYDAAILAIVTARVKGAR